MILLKKILELKAKYLCLKFKILLVYFESLFLRNAQFHIVSPTETDSISSLSLA